MSTPHQWRTRRSCCFKLYCHLIFITKYRRDVFTKNMLVRTNKLLEKICDQLECELLEFNGEEDHIHLMISYPPKLSIANLVGRLKGKSSYYIRKEYWAHVKKKLWGKHFWSPSYCAVSCGGAPLEILKTYIENQRLPPKQKYENIPIR